MTRWTGLLVVLGLAVVSACGGGSDGDDSSAGSSGKGTGASGGISAGSVGTMPRAGNGGSAGGMGGATGASTPGRGGTNGTNGGSMPGGSDGSGGASGSRSDGGQPSSGSGGAGAGSGGEEHPEATCAAIEAVDVDSPDHVVGTGTPGSCDEAALRSAVEAGGTITFDCGSDPVTIELASPLGPTADVVLDGGDRVTLDGAKKTRHFEVNTGNYEATSPHLTVQRMRFVNAKSQRTESMRDKGTDLGGGSIYFWGGSVTVIDSHFSENECPGGGAEASGGAIHVAGLGELVVSGSVFESNSCSQGGALGGLGASMIVVNSRIEENHAIGVDGANGSGGAIYMDGRGREFAMCGSQVNRNTANGFGGAMFRTGYENEPNVIDRSTFDGNQVVDLPGQSRGAGALYLQGVNVTLENSTISRNQAQFVGGVWILSHAEGEGATGVANLTNVTIANNAVYERADFTTQGLIGGLNVEGMVTGTLQNCTIAGNKAQFSSGVSNPSLLTINNTIISNIASNLYTPLNCIGTMFNSPAGMGHSNIQWPVGPQDDMDCVTGILRADPLLGELGDHGGATETMLPGAGSPALGAGSDCAEADQRGEPRSANCTIGAYEVN